MIRSKKVIVTILSLALSISVLVACGNKETTDEEIINNPDLTAEETILEEPKEEIQENGLTKAQEIDARKITEDFASLRLQINYITDTKDTYLRWINMLSDFGQAIFDDIFIDSYLEAHVNDKQIVNVENIDITSIKKVENEIWVEYTTNLFVENSIYDDNKTNKTINCALLINDNGKIEGFKNGEDDMFNYFE